MSTAPIVAPFAPPVAERPKCGWCLKPLRPEYLTAWERRQTEYGFAPEPVSRAWSGRYHGTGSFCSQRHAVWFAEAAHKFGMRVKS